MWVFWTALALAFWPPAVTQKLAAGSPARGVAAPWRGTIKAGWNELPLVIKLSKKSDGNLVGELDSPDQGASGLPLGDVRLKGRAFHFALKMAHAIYDGELSDDGSEITGKWKQSGQSYPLTFKRLARAPAAAHRPQTPKRPYPYREIPVRYENKKAGVKLAATLTVPRGRGPFPAAVLLTGSGPQDRDETILGHKPFLVLADYLTRHGIAVLRADDRGVGGSTGSTPQSTTADFADDALAGVAYLRSRHEIDGRRIGFIGHSEGGMIGPLAASRSPDVAFVVMLAGTGLPGEQVLNLQGAAIMKVEGADARKIAAERALQERLFSIVRHEKDSAAAQKKLLQVIAEQKGKLAGDDKKELEEVEAGIMGQLTMVQTPWFRFFLDYDPRPALKKVRVRVLALNGAKDIQVTARENLAAIALALREGGNRDVTIKELPGLNHLFQHCQTGSVGEYGKIQETIAPEVLRLIADWILKKGTFMFI